MNYGPERLCNAADYLRRLRPPLLHSQKLSGMFSAVSEKRHSPSFLAR